MLNVHRFLYTVLLALVRDKQGSPISISFDTVKGQLFLNGKALPLAGEGYTEEGLGNRIDLLALKLGIRDLTLSHADIALRALLKDRGTASKSEIIEVLLSSTLRKDNSSRDVIKQWRQAFEMRVLKAAFEHFRIEWLHQVPEEKWRDYLESGPLLEKWPRRLLEDRFWAYTDTVFLDMEPFRLDEIWTDLYLINPDEPGGFLDNAVEGSLSKLLDYRYEEMQWFAEPAAFVMEQIQGTVAVIGAPGCGKTTMLKWLARQLILNPNGKFLLPLFVSLRQYTLANHSSNPDCSNIVEYALLSAGIQHKRQRELWLNFLAYLAGSERDNILLLLDGWDEVPAEDRPLLKKELEDLSHGYSYIITSRPSAYPRSLPTDRFYEIAELPWDSIYNLVTQWFEAQKKPSMADVVLDYLDKFPDLKRMARNPFLLSLICGLTCFRDHISGMELPRSRTELYRESVRRIIIQYNSNDRGTKLDGIGLRNIERLAYWLFTSAIHAPCYVFDLSDVISSGSNEDFLDKALKPARLITNNDNKGESFHFLHTTFQEYFAACHIASKDRAEVEELFRRFVYDSAWQEIFSFTAGQTTEFPALKNLFWDCMRKIAASPDRFGFIYIQLAHYVAESGQIDGGTQLLGVDLRERLWHFIISEEKVNHYVDAYVLLDACGYVGRVKDYLAQPNVSSRLDAKLIRSLKRVKRTETSDELVRQIINGDKNAGAVASYQLNQVLDHRGLQILLKEAVNPIHDVEVRKRIISALGYSGRFESIDVLYGIAGENQELSPSAITALGHIGGAAAVSRLKELFEQQKESDASELIVSALGNCRCLEARDYLLYLLALPSEEHSIAQKILEELSEMPINRGSEMLIEYLNHPDCRVRFAAAAALVNAAPGKGKITDVLIKAGLEDPDANVREQALASLRDRARPSDARSLVRIVEATERTADEKANALRALVHTASRCRLLQDGSWLLQLASQTVHRAFKETSDPLALEAAQVSHLLGVDTAPLLMEIVAGDSFSPMVREAAVVSLGKLRYKPAELLLLELLKAFPNAVGDEDEAETNPGNRLGQSSAEALTVIDPAIILNQAGITARNALADFARKNSCLVFDDHIKGPAQNASGQLDKKNIKKKILFISANQVGAKRLELDREYREIDAALRGSKHRERLELIPKFAVRFTDFRQALLDHEPQIVHFSGHGTEDGLMVLDEMGIFSKIMSAEAVAELFKLCSGHVQCVILSACYSELQAETIAEHIPYVIGMKKEIKDTSAIAFAAGFYDALGAGRTIEDAFQFGRQAILQSYPKENKHLIPILKKKRLFE